MSDDGPVAAGGPPATVAGGGGGAATGGAAANVVDSGAQNGYKEKPTFTKAHFDAKVSDMAATSLPVSRKNSIDLGDYFVSSSLYSSFNGH